MATSVSCNERITAKRYSGTVSLTLEASAGIAAIKLFTNPIHFATAERPWMRIEARPFCRY
jgi:hypothetical protein